MASRPDPITRRRLLTSAAAAAALPYGARALAFMPGTEWSQIGQNETQIPFTNDDQPDDLTNQIVWQQPFDWHTPAARLYEVTHYDKPPEASDGRIDITGMVERPRTLSLEELRRLPSIEYINDKTLESTERFAKIAGELDMSVTTLAVAWTLSRDFVDSTIVGATHPDQLDDSLAAAGKAIPFEALMQIDKISKEIRYPMG